MSEPLQVTVLPDGPLKISNAGEVRFCGQPLAAEGDLYLCRCGDSTNAPFCDGTHAKVGFSGACESARDSELRVWEGQALRTFFNPDACMHVYFCKPLAELRERELGGDAAAASEIVRVVESCPSGALTYEAKGALPPPPVATGPSIDIIEGGEVRVRGAYEINEALLAHMDDDRATLCRCGRSKNKPWCDGRHRGKKGFR